MGAKCMMSFWPCIQFSHMFMNITINRELSNGDHDLHWQDYIDALATHSHDTGNMRNKNQFTQQGHVRNTSDD